MSPPSIVVLNPMAFDGVGPSETSARIAKEWLDGSMAVHVFGGRCRRRSDGLYVQHPARIGLNLLPYRYSRYVFAPLAEWLCLSRVDVGQVCHVWPSASTDARKRLRDRGAISFYEMINVHTSLERKILDTEFEAEGINERHHLSDDTLIEKQRRDLALSDFIFASNEFVHASLVREGHENELIIDVSYGAYPLRETDWHSQRHQMRSPGQRHEPVFLYVGRLSIGKAVHRLLRAWSVAAVAGSLVLAGQMDATFRRHYSHLLEQPNVRWLGHVDDVNRLYSSADVFIFPSLAEGGPQVTYEAASHGLPLIVSPMGGGRLARDGHNALVCEPRDEAALAAAIRLLAGDSELRKRLGEQAKADSARFTWKQVADQRLKAMIERGNHL